MYAKKIGLKLKALRKTRGLTQEQLAIAVGLKRSTISNYEIGRRNMNLSELETIADYLGVGLDYFGLQGKQGVADLIANARVVFEDKEIPYTQKADAYKELLRMYLELMDNKG